MKNKYGGGDFSWDGQEIQADLFEAATCASKVGLESLRVCGDVAHHYLELIPVEILKELLSTILLP